MSKDKLTDYDATASNNTDIGGIDINQGTMIPSNVDNAIREIMSHLKDFAAGTEAVSSIAVSGDLMAGSLDLGTTTDAATVSSTATDYQLQLGSAQSTTGDIGRNISFDSSGTTTAAINTVDGGTGTAQSLAFYTHDGSSLNEAMRILPGGGLTFNGDTATANALDDYEEGTWTPTYIGSTTNPSVTYDIQVGKYVKVGGLVHAAFVLRSDAASGGSGNLFVSGLPFAGAVTTNAFYSGSVGYSGFFTTRNPQALHIGSNGTTIVLICRSDSTDANSSLRLAVGTSNLTNAANCNFLVAQMTYPTDA